MEEKEELVRKFASEGNWAEVYKLYNEIYVDDYTPEEGLSIPLCLTQKADYRSTIGKHDEALRMYNTALEMKKEEVGEGDNGRGTLAIQRSIGNVLLCQNKLEEAWNLLEDTFGKQMDLLDENKDGDKGEVEETRYLMAIVCERQGELEKALELYERVFEGFSELFGDQVDITAHVQFIITSLKLKMEAKEKPGLDLESILKIVDYGPSVFSIKRHWDEGKDTVLHRVVRSNVLEIIGVVFDAIIADPDEEKVKEFLNFENSEIQTPLTLAVKNNCEDGVKFLLQNGIKYGLDVNKTTSFGQNALQLATYENNEAIKNLLLTHAAASGQP